MWWQVVNEKWEFLRTFCHRKILIGHAWKSCIEFDRMASSQVRPYATLWNFDFELFIMLPNSWIFTLICWSREYQLISWRFQGHTLYIMTENPCWTTVRTTLHGNTCMYREDYAAPWCIVNHTLVPLEVWSCIYSLSDNDNHYFSQLEATTRSRDN